MSNSILTIKGSKFFICPAGFDFVNQASVEFYGFRLSKQQLIKCCEFFISELHLLGYSDNLKCGFNLKCFKYYELSVYLHGLISLYCSRLEIDSPSFFDVIRFSHLPHEVLKADKETLEIECALLHTRLGTPIYVCFPYVPFASSSFEGLKSLVSKTHLSRKYNLVFTLK